ncbi:interleukin-6 receptor subunit alpha isoform X2 [Etheostoma cragini]|uniref:interleukin-6 receptor subunit alpha isoform X2 n=1 Tax=Etheostoma cragini TaxID=417921 RepID=UPI00155F1F33|nr:interleukin-6 receptor subunit alpha isoform X2 [Etheostoma cragini]
MRIILPLLCVLCATPVHCIFDGTCPRKDPPPGVLVLSPGSSLVLTCSGHVEVDGVKVSVSRQGSNTNRRKRSSDATPTSTVNIRSNAEVLTKSFKHTGENSVSEGYHPDLTYAGENRSLGRTATGYTASPTTHPNRLLKDESDWEAYGMDGDSDYEEEGEEGSRVTRGIKSRLQWKWNSRIVGKGDRDWGQITFERRRASLSLPSVRLTDSGRYSCYHRGRERFSLKVNIADPPENPSLFCYKRSPSSKIRCEWAPQKPVTIRPNCYLLLNKSPVEALRHSQCSYSSRRSRCWCALEHNWDELRTLHMVYLCVTSIAGNATSPLQYFTPMGILKPDPPSDVSVQQEEGQERMRVSWNLPISWMPQDHFYKLLYEIKYRPLISSFWQIHKIEDQLRSFTITDAMPGFEYLIQLRTREEYDGQWSDWSTPASRWTVDGGQTPSPWSFGTDATTFPVYMEGSGTDEDVSDVPQPSPTGVAVSHYILWLSCGSFVLLLAILAAYIFRHKDRVMSKLQSLSVITQCVDSTCPPPSTSTLPEGPALVTLAPAHCQEPPLSKVEKEEEENEEEQWVKERIEAMHFNNTSYFFFLRE